MLTRILELLEARGALTIDELARETGASTEALRGMLDTLARRRLIDWKGVTGTGSSCDAGQGPAPVVTLSLDLQQHGAKNNAPGGAGGERTAKTRGR